MVISEQEMEDQNCLRFPIGIIVYFYCNEELLSTRKILLDSFIFFGDWPKNLPKQNKFGSTHFFLQSIGTPR